MFQMALLMLLDWNHINLYYTLLHIETLAALLALCQGFHQSTVVYYHKKQIIRSLAVFLLNRHSSIRRVDISHGPFARYVKLRVRMRRECRERFPRHRRWAIPTCITARAWRTCRDACRDRQLSVSFEIGGGGKRSRHSRRMRNLQFYVSGKRPITCSHRHCSRGFSCVSFHDECFPD